MQLNPYLNFSGQCLDAFKFYEQTLGGKITGVFTYGDSPMAGEMPAEMQNHVMHVRLEVGQAVLMGADSPTDRYDKPQGMSVSIHVSDPAEAERIFGALAQNGTVQMPIQETFWAQRFGMCVDRFGTPWMVNCEKDG